jgi:hypothetical protein
MHNITISAQIHAMDNNSDDPSSPTTVDVPAYFVFGVDRNGDDEEEGDGDNNEEDDGKDSVPNGTPAW